MGVSQDLDHTYTADNASMKSKNRYKFLFDTTYVKRIWTEPFVVRPSIDSLTLYVETDQDLTEIEYCSGEKIILKKTNDYPWYHEQTIYSSGKVLLQDLNCDGSATKPTNRFSRLSTIEGIRLNLRYENGDEKLLQAVDGNYLEALRIYTLNSEYVDELPQPVQISKNIFATEYSYNYVVPFRTDGDYFNPTNSEDQGSRLVFKIFRSYYNFFEDSVDIAFIDYNQMLNIGYTNTGAGQAFNVVEGVGENVDTPENIEYKKRIWGSDKILSLYISLGASTLGRSYRIINHEILHTWLRHHVRLIRPSTGFGNGYGTYKSYTYNEEDSTYTPTDPILNYLDEDSYSDYELYIMRLLPADSIDYPLEWIDRNGKLLSYDKDGLLKKLGGPRKPSYTESRKSFRTNMIIPTNRPMFPIEFAYYDLYKRAMVESTIIDTSKYFDVFRYNNGYRASIKSKVKLKNGKSVYEEDFRIADAPVLDSVQVKGLESTLVWSKDSESQISKHIIYRGIVGNSIQKYDSVDGESLTYKDSNLDLGVSYNYSISSVNMFGVEGSLSNLR